LRRIVIALAGAATAVLASVASITAATAATAQVPTAVRTATAVRTGCSASYLDSDYRLGPATTPNRGAVALELAGYRRFDGMTRQRFIARYWDASTGSWKYPPDNGFLLIYGKPVEFRLTLEPGESLDRYGSLYGSFLAPAGSLYSARSIPPSNLDDSPGFTCNYHAYRILKAFKVEAGPVAPAFGQPGLGLQYQLLSALLPGHPSTANIFWLVDHGYLTVSNK
jgi:Tuberculosis necrotizing toxin